jgi:HAD superfamily hydrolase (TIGR01549 family)
LVEAVLFDLWGTLARNVREPGPMQVLAEALGIDADPAWRRRLERGMMLAPAAGIEGALRQIEARTGLRVADDAARQRVLARWRDAERDVALFPDALPALASLRPGFRLGLCSNTQSFGLGFLARAGVWERFDAAALSFEVGAVKPHPAIFSTLCARLGVSPDRALMVGDDPVADVAGARAAGLRAIRIDRAGARGAPGESIESLAELRDRIAAFTT